MLLVMRLAHAFSALFLCCGGAVVPVPVPVPVPVVASVLVG